MSLMEKEMYEFGPYSLDPAERVILRDGAPLSLTPKVFDTLVYLVRNSGRLLTKDELLKEVWPDTFVEEVNLAVNISTLRKAFGEGPQDGRYIATVAGRGYRFVAEVQKIPHGNGNQQSPGNSSGSEVTFGEDSGPREQGFQRHNQQSNGAGQFVATPRSAKKRHFRSLGLWVGIALFVAAVTGSYFWLGQRNKNPQAVAAPSIAVLPFSDLSPGKDHS